MEDDTGVTELAHRLKNGDHDALKECYDEWSGLIYTLAYKSVGNRADAEDITQRVFISAWESRHTIIPSERALPAWLIGITKRRIADHYDAARRHQRRVDKARTLVAVANHGPDEYIPGDVVAAGLLANQPEPRRTVLKLAILEDHTHSMIAESLGMPLGTVKSHVRRGLKAIKEALEEVRNAE